MEDIKVLKSRLGLDGKTDLEILQYALNCSQEIKKEFSKKESTLSNRELMINLGKVDNLLLQEIMRLKSIR